MLKSEKERIKNELIRRGYSRRRVENMEPWVLLSYRGLIKPARECNSLPSFTLGQISNGHG